MSIKLAVGPTCARALPCVEPAGCTYTHARAMQFLYGRTDVRTDVRTHHVTTKFSRLHGLPYFLRYGAPLRGPSAREGAPLLHQRILIFHSAAICVEEQCKTPYLQPTKLSQLFQLKKWTAQTQWRRDQQSTISLYLKK